MARPGTSTTTTARQLPGANSRNRRRASAKARGVRRSGATRRRAQELCLRALHPCWRSSNNHFRTRTGCSRSDRMASARSPGSRTAKPRCARARARVSTLNIRNWLAGLPRQARHRGWRSWPSMTRAWRLRAPPGQRMHCALLRPRWSSGIQPPTTLSIFSIATG